MSNGTELAVSQAARVNEIGFPEFTAKLVTDVFDALVAANIRQTEAYVELVQQVSKSLTQYINDTRDDISGADVLHFLAAILPGETDEEPSKVVEGVTLTADDASILNPALSVEGLDDNNEVVDTTAVPTGSALTTEQFDMLLTAVTNRLAANKYSLLQQMVQQGILRLVVETGVIETRLLFTTYGQTFYQSHATKYQRDNYRKRSKASTGFLTSMIGNAASATRRSRVTISTARETNRDISGSRVQIYGRVQINFKTDYQPLGGE